MGIKSYMMIRSYIFLVFTSCFLLSACGQQTFEEKLESLYKNTVPLIKAEELSDKKNVVLLDIRSPEEYEVSHLEGAVMVDYDRFSKNDVKEIKKDQEVIVYCSVGYRSERIGEKLQKMGFKNVKNLYGGIFDWKNKDLLVVNQYNQPTDSVHTYNRAWSKWLKNGIKVYE